MRLPRAGIALGLVAAVSFAACGNGQPGFTCEHPDTGTLLCIYAGSESAEGRLMTAGEERNGVLGSYCWEVERGLTTCADIAEIPRLGPPLMIDRGSRIALRSDADDLSVDIGTLEAETGSRFLDRVTELDLSDGRATIDVETGRYVLSVFGRWDGQDAELYFPISVT